MLAVTKERPAPGLEFGAERPEPRRLPGEALLKPLMAGVCGTDLHIEAWEGPYRDLEPYLPVILGHEFIAEVVEGDDFRPGERVVVISVFGCGACDLCMKGTPQLCPEARSSSLGMARDGGLAELLTVPERRLLTVPEGIPLATAAMCEPFATTVRAVASVEAHDGGGRVAVLGPGAVGLMIALVAALRRPDRLVVAGTERDGERLELARNLGFEAVVLPRDSSSGTLIEVLGGPADVVFEAAGAPEAMMTGLEALSPRGSLIVVGMHDSPVPMDLGGLVRGERRVLGSYAAAPRDWKLALKLLGEASVDLRSLVGPVFDLAESEAAFRATERGVVGRVLVKCAS